jgi:hypothetical protein
VTDAFTGGGAQADRLSTEFHTPITWLVTQTTRRHTLKYGFNIPDWSRRGLSDQTNQIGTLSFATLGDLSANRPFSAVLQRGDPRVVFIEKNVGGFLQDEWQLRPNLSLSTGCATTGKTTSAMETTSRPEWQSRTRRASRGRQSFGLAQASSSTGPAQVQSSTFSDSMEPSCAGMSSVGLRYRRT